MERVLELLAEINQDSPTDAPPAKPLGVDSILPDGWRDEAHRSGRSPWDPELERAQIEASERALMLVLASPRSADSTTSERTPPDRRVTELDWRNLTLGQES